MTSRHPVALALLALVFLWGCDRKRPDAAAPPAPPVTVASPVSGEVTPYWEYTGTLKGLEDVEIRPKVSGFLDGITYEAGALVDVGQQLFQIDPKPFEALVASAQAGLEAANAALAKEEFNLTKIQDLIKRQAASQFELTNQTAVRDSAKAAVDGAKAQLDAAQLNLGYTKVVSPVRGIASRNLMDRGALVGPSTLLATVIDQSKVYAYFNISERDLLEIIADHANMKPIRDMKPEERPVVELALAGQDDYRFTGRIDSIANTVDPGTGTIGVRAIFDNKDAQLLSGMFVRVRVPDAPRKALLVPEVAIGTDQAGKFVLVVDHENTVQRRYITPGLLQNGLREVLKGVAPEDRVIVNGIQRARPGGKVTPLTPEQAGAAARSAGAPAAPKPGNGTE